MHAKANLANVAVARDLIAAHVPAHIVARIDLKSVRVSSNEFVTNLMRRRLADVVYELTIDDQSGYAFIYVEQQTKPDRFMVLKMLEVAVSMMRHYKGKCHVPLVIPVLLHNGKAPYPQDYPLNLFDLIYPGQQDLARFIYLSRVLRQRRCCGDPMEKAL